MTRNEIHQKRTRLKRRLDAVSNSRDMGANGVEVAALCEELRRLDNEEEQIDEASEPNQEIYVPSDMSTPVPLLVLLHGAGWNGGSQIELWKTIAERERIALLAPTSLNHEWTHPNDYTALIQRFNDTVSTLKIDNLRRYLVGHSRGGQQALRVGLLYPNQIAALALHSPTYDPMLLHQRFMPDSRRLPVRVWVGSDNERDGNRHWADMLQLHFQQHPDLANVDLDVRLLEEHGHRDYNTREGLLDEMWVFLKHKLILSV